MDALHDMTPDEVDAPVADAQAAPEAPLETVAEGTHTWEIADLWALPARAVSERFRVGGGEWHVLLFARGAPGAAGTSVFVVHDFPPGADAGPGAPPAVCAEVAVSLAVQGADGAFVTVEQKATRHRYETWDADWGWRDYTSSLAPSAGPQAAVLRVDVRVVRDRQGVLWHSFAHYDARRVTGHVGLANQGATCYMNSLLQSLYHTPLFRRAIYAIPTAEEQAALLAAKERAYAGDATRAKLSAADADMGNALALQRIFWRLQEAPGAVGTEELTRAFGWDSHETFVQSDVHEFSRVLMENLEERMKGTRAEGAIESLFVGATRNVVRCLSVPYESRRTEPFYDVQVPVRGMHVLERSLAAYVAKERLVGENKYMAEGHGLQDAEKFVVFEALPPILHVHLERYTFDMVTLGTVKINDRLAFPRRINMSPYVAEDVLDDDKSPSSRTGDAGDDAPSYDSHVKGSDAFEKGSESYEKGSDAYGKGSDAYEKGSDAYEKGSDAYEKGYGAFEKGPDASNSARPAQRARTDDADGKAAASSGSAADGKSKQKPRGEAVWREAMEDAGVRSRARPARDDMEYALQAVFVHSGDSHGGHYFVFIRDLAAHVCADVRHAQRPQPESCAACANEARDEGWLRFDDAKVYPVSGREAVEDNFGGESRPRPDARGLRGRGPNAERARAVTNAYMLVYVRVADVPLVCAPIARPPAHLAAALAREDALERARRAAAHEARMALRLDVLTEDLLADGADRALEAAASDGRSGVTRRGPAGGRPAFNLFNHENANADPTPRYSVAARRDMTVGALRAALAGILGTDAPLRLWTFAARRNRTVRLAAPLEAPDDAPLSSVWPAPGSYGLGLESRPPPEAVYVEAGASPLPFGAAVLTLKAYDAARDALRVVRPALLVVQPGATTVAGLAARVRGLLGPDAGGALELFEEVKPGKLVALSAGDGRTLAEVRLGTGDILAACVRPAGAAVPAARTLSALYERLAYAACLSVSPLDTSSGGGAAVAVRVNLRDAYASVLRRVAAALGHPVEFLRLHVAAPAPNQNAGSLDGTEVLATYAEHVRRDAVPSGEAPPAKRPATVPLRAPSADANLGTVLVPVVPAALLEDPAVLLACAPAAGIPVLWEATARPVAELEDTARVALVDAATGKTLDAEVAPGDTPADLARAGTVPPRPAPPAGVAPETHAYDWTLRLFEEAAGRVARDYGPDDALAAPLPARLFFYWASTSLLVSVFSFARDAGRPHGRPARLALVPGEPWAETRLRLFSHVLPLAETEVADLVRAARPDGGALPPAVGAALPPGWEVAVVSASGRVVRTLADADVLAAPGFLGPRDALGVLRPDVSRPPSYAAAPGAGAGTRGGAAERGIRIRAATPRPSPSPGEQ